MTAVRLRLLFGTLVLAAAYLTLAEIPTRGVAEQFSPSLNTAREDHGELVKDGCRAHGKRVEPLICEYGDKDSSKRVVLFGDSHALQWGPALIPLAKKRGWKLITLVRAGCPIADVKAETPCNKWRDRALNRIESIRPTHIILSTSISNRYRLKHQGQNLSRRASETQLREGMVRTINRLKEIQSLAGGKNEVTLIRDQVVAPFVPAECLMSKRGRTSDCQFRNKRKFAPGFDWEAAKETGIGPTIDPTTALCDGEWCAPAKGRTLIYRDSDHITATYARTLSDWLYERLPIE